MYLIDTNIFLEILLAQERREICKKFLNNHIGNLFISDFSLHSIGVILFKNNKEDIYQKFVIDSLPQTGIITLPKESYKDLAGIKRTTGFDFDDAYQFVIAKERDLEIVTMDKDFERAKNVVKVLFL
ncbi:MAG: PIN domain-containing protein [Nitrospirota bacterium]